MIFEKEKNSMKLRKYFQTHTTTTKEFKTCLQKRRLQTVIEIVTLTKYSKQNQWTRKILMVKKISHL